MYLSSPRTVSFTSTVKLTTGESVAVSEVLGPDTVIVVPTIDTYGRNLK
jgi:hypothetical protein